MIQIYCPENTDFSKNGDMTLMPSSVELHAVLNGAWESTMTHSLDQEGRWKYIENGAVVKLPSFYGGEQLYRIKDTQKSDDGISAQMEPIFYDSMDDCFLVDIRPTNDTGQQALDLMTAPNSKYSGKSDIASANTAYYQYKNLMEAINGDDDNSFIKRWGGEILFNNFEIIINERVGSDNGAEVRYGLNVPVNGFQEEIDNREIVTRIYPKSYNGHTLSGDRYVDSPLVDVYPTIKAKTITFDDVKMREDEQDGDAESGIIICDNQQELDDALTQKCNNEFSLGADKPKITLNVNMVLLKDTEQYKNFQALQEVGLGDTVHCIHSKLGIDTKARIIEITYDALKQIVSSVVIGDYQYNYFNNVSSSMNKVNQAIRNDGTVIAEQIYGFINAVNAMMVLQSTVSNKVEGVAFKVEDLNPNSPTYGCMIWGTQGIQISRTRTDDGSDWDWTTAMTASGVVADIIIAGILSDKTGRSFWNLDTGELQLYGKMIAASEDGSCELEDNQLIFYDSAGNRLCYITTRNGSMWIQTYMEEGGSPSANAPSLFLNPTAGEATLQCPNTVYIIGSTLRLGVSDIDTGFGLGYTGEIQTQNGTFRVRHGIVTQ